MIEWLIMDFRHGKCEPAPPKLINIKCKFLQIKLDDLTQLLTAFEKKFSDLSNLSTS